MAAPLGAHFLHSTLEVPDRVCYDLIPLAFCVDRKLQAVAFKDESLSLGIGQISRESDDSLLSLGDLDLQFTVISHQAHHLTLKLGCVHRPPPSVQEVLGKLGNERCQHGKSYVDHVSPQH